MKVSLRHNAGRMLVTGAMIVCAVLLGRNLWDYYVNAPWTRDGRVTADVVRIAPEVSGTVLAVRVRDNQFVHRGDVLFEIDPRRFRLAVEEATAERDSRAEDRDQKVSVAERRSALQTSGAVSAETIEQAVTEAATARADTRRAEVALEIATLDLERTRVRAPADGWVTNLHLRPGAYVTAGQGAVALIDSTSFHAIGYFRETQLERIRLGDPVRVELMGFGPVLTGHVESIGRGIADGNAAADQLGLPTVEPVFNWVRLAQRIPVRVRIDEVPADLALASGMTASIYVEPEAAPASRGL